MTQKELLYIEDAIGHEQNIISICNESLNILEDDNLVSFIEKELEIHNKTLNNLIDILEVKTNE